jgi:malonyl-CoA/methylmalonyl-CoA synthetase
VLRRGGRLGLAELKTWAATRLAPHKVPARLLIVAALPCNALGKVTKSALLPLFTRDE